MAAAPSDVLPLPAPHLHAARRSVPIAHKLNRVFFVLYCTAAALDFHSQEQGGTNWQIAVSLVSTIAFALFVINARRTAKKFRSLTRITWLWWVYLASTPCIAYWRGVPIGHYLRILLPSLFLGESLIIGLLLLSDSAQNARLIFRGLFYASAVSAVVYLVRGLSMGLELLDVRYYILSPLLIVLFSFSLCRLLFEGPRAGIINVLGLGGSLMIIFLSVTRTFFAGIGVVLLFLVLAWLRPPVWVTTRVRHRLRINLLGIGVVLTVLAATVFTVFPAVLEHWSERSSTLGTKDPTALTRIAEAAGEIAVIRSDKSHLLFGSGIGADHKNDVRYLIGVQALVGEDYSSYTFSPGHIGWVYQFFTSGLLFGWVLPFVFLFAIWKANHRGAPYIARLAGIALVAALAITTLGNMLGDRGAGVGLGLLIALALHGDEQSAASIHRKHRRGLTRDIFAPSRPQTMFRHRSAITPPSMPQPRKEA